MKKTIHPSQNNSSGTPFRSRGSIQTKLAVNQPGDKHEAEADHAADRLVNGGSPAGPSASSGSPAPVQLKPIAQTLTPRIQRKEAPGQMGQLDVEGTEDKMGTIGHEGIIQRKAADSSSDLSAPALDDQLKETKGQGTPLAPEVKSEMESGFGADFSQVKTHTGKHAADMNKSLGAKAFTNQGDIYFNQGNFDPASKDGKHLLAHELTHTIQQGASTPAAGKDQNSNPEKEEINPTEVAQAKKQAENTPGAEQQAEKLTQELIGSAKNQAAANTSAPAAQAASVPAKQEGGTPVETSAKKEASETPKTPAGEKGKTAEKAVEQPDPETLDKAVEKEVTEKTKEKEPKEKQKTPAPKEKEGGDKEDKKEPGEKDKNEADPGPEGVKEDYDNPPPVKDAKVEEATDKVGEGVGVDEEANVNVEGLIMTAQQFRDQGKESVARAKTQTEHREQAEKKMREIDKKIEGSDKSLQTAEKNTNYREKQLPKTIEKGLATSKQRQEKVSNEVGTYSSEYKKNKGTAEKLKKETGGLNKGSRENSNPDEKESGEVSSNFEEMESGSADMADGMAGGGTIAEKQKGDAQKAKTKNTTTEKELKESKANIQKSKQKISSEKNRNKDAKSKSKSLKTKFQSSKNQEEKLHTEGMSLMKTSFEMENETHRAQYFYYKDMKSIEGADELILQEELRAQSEMGNGPEALLFRYANLKSEGERETFLASLSDGERQQLGARLLDFNLNFEAWIENKKLELGDRVEQKRAAKIDHYNAKRNKGLQSPLNKATRNIDKISKTGLLWTSMTKSLESMWEGLKNITWADVSKIGLAMINPLETYNTIAEAVGGIWTDLSDWKGFSEDPVGMILQKGSSVGVKLLTIAGVVTGLLTVLSALTTVAAFFFPPLAPVAAWLIGATGTMFTVTFWIGLITTVLSVLSGIKNIYNVHTAKTAEQIYQGNHKIKTDAANTTAGVMAMVGAKSPPVPLNMSKLGNIKNVVVKTYKTSKGFIKRGVRKIPRLVSATFKKETWTDLYAGFKKFSAKKADDVFGGGNKKKLTNKTDQINDVKPNKVLKKVDEPKVSSQPGGKFEKKLPEKTKPVDIDTKTPAKTPDLDTDVPVTNKLPETDASDLKKMDKDIHAEKTNLDKTEAPKDKQVANGEKPPKSEILEDDPNLNDKELEKLKKYEDKVDDSTKKKMKEDADSDVKKGKDHDNKAKALMMARLIIAANDKIDTPISGLLTELAPLKAIKGVKDFKAESKGNGKFEIYLIASKIKAGDYDIDPEKEKQKTKTQLPEKNILSEDGVTIKHNYGNTGSGVGSLKEHAPIHYHVNYKNKEYRLFPSGKPLKDSPIPPANVIDLMKKNRSKLQRVEKRIGKWFKELPDELKRK
jgi:hypothetical protein